MVSVKKITLSLMAVIAVVGGIMMSQPKVAHASPDGDAHPIFCSISVLVVSKNQTGQVIGTESYQKEFSLQEGDFLSDDFSTRTRFKFFDAAMTKSNGDTTINVDWFADVTVFNSVDFNTSVILADGQKSGRAASSHSFYNSGGSTTTTYTLTCIEN